MRLVQLLVIVVIVATGVVALVGFVGSQDSPELSEAEIKDTLEGLPYRFSYREVEHSGGDLVVATAYRSDSATQFAVLSGDPEVEGRLLPRGPVEEAGIGDGGPNALFLRLAETKKASATVQVRIQFALCEARLGHECGV